MGHKKNLPVPYSAPQNNGSVNAVDLRGSVRNLSVMLNGAPTPLLLKLVRSRGKDKCLYVQYWEGGDWDDAFICVDVFEAYYPYRHEDQGLERIIPAGMIANQQCCFADMFALYGQTHTFYGVLLDVYTADGDPALVTLWQNCATAEYALIIANVLTGEQGYYIMDPDCSNIAYLDGEADDDIWPNDNTH